MKKVILFLLATIMLSGCSLFKYAEYSHIVYYDEYPDFFISEANSVSFEYEPIGSVSAYIVSGYVRGKYREATPETAIYLLYQKAKEENANGIINLKVEKIYTYNNKGYATGSYIRASGMAIIK